MNTAGLLIIPLPYGRENHPFSDVCRQQTVPIQNLFRTLLHELMTAKTRVHELMTPKARVHELEITA